MMQLFKNLFFTTIFFSLFIMSAHSQTPVKNYEKEWKKVEDFTNKGLPKSALAEVKKIYDLAKKDGSAGSPQDAQVIKALIHITSLQNENREDNQVFSITEIEKEISMSREPAASLLKSLLAGMYWNYYQNNRWKIYNRTQTEKFEKADIATWTTEDFHRKIGELYLQSIKEEKLLQQAKLGPFEAIIIKGNVRHLRPTLYDLLAHRALSYFENDERDIKKPAYAGFFMHQIAEHRRYGERIDQRDGHGEADAQAEFFKKAAADPAHQRAGAKHGDDGQGRRNHGFGHFPRAAHVPHQPHRERQHRHRDGRSCECYRPHTAACRTRLSRVFSRRVAHHSAAARAGRDARRCGDGGGDLQSRARRRQGAARSPLGRLRRIRSTGRLCRALLRGIRLVHGRQRALRLDVQALSPDRA